MFCGSYVGGDAYIAPSVTGETIVYVRADVGIGPYETEKSFIQIDGDIIRAVFLKFS